MSQSVDIFLIVGPANLESCLVNLINRNTNINRNTIVLKDAIKRSQLMTR